MNLSIFQDRNKINVFAQIQKDLLALGSIPPKKKDKPAVPWFENFIRLIPQSFKTIKDDLMMIIQIFAHFARYKPKMQHHVYLLIKQIMPEIRTYLQNEDSFFVNVFKGLNCFLLLMYREGLISDEQLILSTQRDPNFYIAAYFLPELYKNNIEYYEKELILRPNFHEKIKKFFQIKEEEFDLVNEITIFENLREKHFNWLDNSGDFNDPVYKEIEKNELIQSIKTDNVDLFITIMERENIYINFQIEPTLFDSSCLFNPTLTLIELAIIYDSKKIIEHFVVLNEVLNNMNYVNKLILTNNEIVVKEWLSLRIEEQDFDYKNEFIKSSIYGWNIEVSNKLLEIEQFIELKETLKFGKTKQSDSISNIIYSTFSSFNFIFLESILLPFFIQNPKYIDNNINEFVMNSFCDMSGSFTSDFLKHQKVKINYVSGNKNNTFLSKALEEYNSKAVETILKNPKIDINCRCGPDKKFLPIHFLFKNFFEKNILNLFVKNPKCFVDFEYKKFDVSPFQVIISTGNFVSLQYMIDNYRHLKVKHIQLLMKNCYHEKHLLCLKILLNYYIKKKPLKKDDEIIGKMNKLFPDFVNQEDGIDFINTLKKILQEIRESNKT